jgi:hypothetical protein
VTFQADLGVKFAIDVAVGLSQLLDFVETMTVMTGCRILVPGDNGLAMNRVEIIFVIIMATGALGDDFGFVTFPVCVSMDIIVTGSAGHIIQLMDAGIVFAGFFLVAAHAFGLSGHDITGYMRVDGSYFDMTAGTGVLAMHGSSISNRRNHVLVASQADFGSDSHAALCQYRFGWHKHGYSEQQKSKDSAVHDLTSCGLLSFQVGEGWNKLKM